MKTVLKYLTPFYGRMVCGFLIKVLGTLSELFIPYILSHILKTVVTHKDIREIVFWGALMIFCAAVAWFGNIVANRMAAKVSRDFSEGVRHDLFAKTLRLSAAQTDRFTIPSLESRITTDTYHIHNFVSMVQRMGVRAPIMIFGGIAITLIMDWYLSLVMLATLPLIFATVYFISKKGVPLYTKVQQSVDKMIRVVREDVQGIRVIKALSKTDYEHRRYDGVNHDLVQTESRAGIIMGSVNPAMTMLMNIGIVAVIALSASRVSNHTSDPETVIAFMQYFTQISMSMMFVGRMFVMFTKCAASAGRIAEVLNESEDINLKTEAECPKKQTDAHIVFKNVSFSYGGKHRHLEKIDFSLPKGASLGIIGATGSGKSTLIKLLLRFYDVSEGAIYIDGVDLRTIPAKEFYAKFGTAMQFDFLYADTIIENIRFGRNLTEEEIISAAKIAQADEFISSFPNGYEHMLSQHGTNISGGQKQRLLISRAIAARPEILILDDSSSALDYKTDANLRKALDERLSETTKITVAQRVSSVKNCDLILVLEEGKIIGAGKHELLLNTCAEYREISDSQMGGAFIE